MEKLSTSLLSKEIGMSAAKLFEVLQEIGYISRKNDSWELTLSGKNAGGEIQKSQKYGEYIVWPKDLKIKKSQEMKVSSKKSLNATSIGEHFKTSSQRINMILSELGLIEKDVAGWRVTKLGRSIGGTEHTHDVSGAHYVLWTENILSYSRLLEVFRHETVVTQLEEVSSIETKNQNTSFREKFEAKLRTQDGHFVRSKAEVIIDNFLYQYRLVHAYERKLPVEEDVYSDFFIPSGNGVSGVYIEYWGLENDEKYLARKNQKLEIYKKYDLSLIELNDEDIQNLDDVLPKKLLAYKIKVY